MILSSLPPEVLAQVVQNLESSDIFSLLQVKELRFLWNGFINVINLGQPEFVCAVPSELVETPVQHILANNIKNHPIPLASLVIAETIDDLSALAHGTLRCSISENVFILIGKGSRSARLQFMADELYERLETVFSPNYEIHSLEMNSETIEIFDGEVSNDCTLFLPNLRTICFNDIQFKFNHAKRVLKAPNLTSLEVSDCDEGFQKGAHLISFPERVILHCTPVRDIFAKQTSIICFDTIINLHLIDTDLEILEGQNFPNMENLKIKNRRQGCLLISKVHAPRMKKLKVLTKKSFDIKECNFNSLNLLVLKAKSLGSLEGNWSPNLKKVLINGVEEQGCFENVSLLKNIESLTIFKCNHILKQIDFNNLKHLNLVDGTNYYPLNSASTHFPNLKTLCLSRVTFCEPIRLQAPRLEILSIQNNDDHLYECDILQQIPSKFPKLKRLRYAGPFFFEDYIDSKVGIKWDFKKHCMWDLESLEFDFNCPSKTTIKRIHVLTLTQCVFPKLKTLVVNIDSSQRNWNIIDINAPYIEYISLKHAMLNELDLENSYYLKGLKVSKINDLNLPYSENIEFLDFSDVHFRVLKIGPLPKLIEMITLHSNARMFLKEAPRTKKGSYQRKMKSQPLDPVLYGSLVECDTQRYINMSDELDELIADILKSQRKFIQHGAIMRYESRFYSRPA